ncbi:MAG: MarR family winged helix-turn-helix transcriptional regulator [Nannocystaceae bacterium]
MREAEIGHEVLTSIRQIVRRIAEHSQYLTRAVGLTVPQLMCLKAIGELEEARAGEITVVLVSQKVQLTPATVSRIIDRLTRADLVIRERRSKDRRRVCLSLTPAGLERFQTLPTPLQEQFIARLGALPDEERRALLGALQRIVQLMDAGDLEAAPMLTPEADVKDDRSA